MHCKCSGISQEGANGASVSSVNQISEYKQTVVKESDTGIEASQRRVFLLGENRWEEPSRLASIDKQVVNTKGSDSTTKCLACRGEGRLMCTGLLFFSFLPFSFIFFCPFVLKELLLGIIMDVWLSYHRRGHYY